MRLTDKIVSVIHEHAKDARLTADLFSGSGAVAYALKNHGYNVIANDILYFSYVLNRGTLTNKISTPRLLELIEYLNNLPTEQLQTDDPSLFITQNYSPREPHNRMYFQRKNALRIDTIRKEIERLRMEINENEYYYLLASLISAIPYVANITGTFAAYLKFWDARTYKQLILEPLPVINNESEIFVYNEYAHNLAKRINTDIVYIDPPYNSREYLPNYHILETIALYDKPTIKGVTGTRISDIKSDFCKKNKVGQAFSDLLQTLNTHYILISYNNEGLLPTEELIEIILQNGKHNTFKLYEYPYRRYKSKISSETKELKEQLFFIEK